MKKSYTKISSLLEKVLVDEPKITDIRAIPGTKSILFHSFLNGKGSITVRNPNNDETCITDSFNVKGTVGYGGGGFHVSRRYIIAVTKDRAVLCFENANSFMPFQIFKGMHKLADPKISPDEKHILVVFDLNEESGLGLLRLEQKSEVIELVSGADFHMHPAWHPDGRMIAWAEWDHPQMPWEASRIMVAHFSEEKEKLIRTQLIAGQEGAQASQPRFSPDGKWLSFIQRNRNWDNLVVFDLKTGDRKCLFSDEEFHLSLPDWVQGQRSYIWEADSHTLTCIGYRDATASLFKVDINNRKITHIPPKPYTWISQIESSGARGSNLFIGSSESVSGEILECDKQKVTPILRKKPAQHHPIPKEIKFETGGGLSAHAWYYPPSEKPGSPPPCIVKFHSGPTAVAHPGYSNESAIFTAMGYAIVYLNYRGSVTFGYDFQHMLHRSWGDVETEDADHLVEHIIANELADPNKMAVMGSSAGGYSLLHMLIKYPGRFNAAICSYAVSDLVDDAENTHKFERFYHRFLTGMYPEEKARFIDRSPLTHVDQISDPVALFHGADDPVVSPKQSELIFKNLKSRNVPAILKIYQDEGHGFHIKETLIDYYNSVFAFLGEHIN